MIIYYPHCIWKDDTGRLKINHKRTNPKIRFICDKCQNEFLEKESIFKRRFESINQDLCVKCSRSIICRMAALKGAYDENGNLKPNSGRFSEEKWESLLDEEKIIRCQHNKKIAIDFHKQLNENPEKKTIYYNKIFQNSKIGYISKAQQEIYDILKLYGYELNGNISGMLVDIINKDKKIAIEYNGDFWHCNPRNWKESDYNTAIKMTAGEKWVNDRNRRFKLRSFGYEVIVIWESDWLMNRNKIYDIFKKITNKEYKPILWKPKITVPLKGRSFDEIYGADKADILKKRMSEQRKGKLVNKKPVWKVTTPEQGVFYIKRLNEWVKNVTNGNSKQLIFEKIKYSNEFEFWDGEKINLTFNIKCPHCNIIGCGFSPNMKRYHFNNCKNIKI